MKLGERFIQQGLLTPARLEAALKAQLIFGGHLGTVLLELGHVDEHTLGNTLAKIYDVHYAPPHFFHDIPKATIELMPKRLVEKLRAVPFDRRERTLDVAMIDPKDLRALDEIAFATGFRIQAWVSPEARIFQVMERYYDVPRRQRYISVCQTLDAASSEVTPTEQKRREHAVLGSAYAPPPYMAALAPTAVETSDPSAEGPPPAPAIAPAGPRAVPPLRSLVDLSEGLCRSENVGELAECAVTFLSGRVERALLFLVRGATATLWCARGLGDKTPLPSMLLPLTSEPLFTLLHERDQYQGPLPDDPRQRLLFETLGIAPPKELVLVPGYLDDRLLVVLYADGGPEAPVGADLTEMKVLVGKLACALHLVALKRKIRTQQEPREPAAASRAA